MVSRISEYVMIFDLYLIGGAAGFYVGQAKHKKTGGWRRWVIAHIEGKRGASSHAHQLLIGGARSRCLGSLRASHGYVNLVEARTWDNLVARNWIPVHPRPRDSARWAPGHTVESRAKVSAALKGRPKTPQTRARMSSAKQGHPVSVETRAKLSVAGRHHSPEGRARQAAALRGRRLSSEHRAKISVALQGKPHSIEHNAKVAAALRKNPPRERSVQGSPEHRAKMSAAMRGKQHSLEAKAKMSMAAKNRSKEHRRKLSIAQRTVWAKRRALV